MSRRGDRRIKREEPAQLARKRRAVSTSRPYDPDRDRRIELVVEVVAILIIVVFVFVILWLQIDCGDSCWAP